MNRSHGGAMKRLVRIWLLLLPAVLPLLTYGRMDDADSCPGSTVGFLVLLNNVVGGVGMEIKSEDAG